jgi:methylisocitrate lyase
MKKTKMLRKLYEEPGIIVTCCVYDPLSARIAEKVGFKVLVVGGYALGASTCITEPLLTMKELVEYAGAIARSVNIPVIADADGGYGDPIHVYRTVKECERAGLAGIFIEDQLFPKRAHYHRDYKEHVIPEELMIEKIKIAIEARDDPDFLIEARSDACRTHGLEEAIKRANAYVKAGAEVIMLFPNTREEAEVIPKRVQAPCEYVNSEGNRVGRPILTIEEAEKMGYKVLTNAIAPILVAASSVEDVLKNIYKTGISGWEQSKMISIRRMIEDTIGLPELYKIEERTTEKS